MFNIVGNPDDIAAAVDAAKEEEEKKMKTELNNVHITMGNDVVSSYKLDYLNDRSRGQHNQYLQVQAPKIIPVKPERRGVTVKSKWW